jgi:hypothetical protein
MGEGGKKYLYGLLLVIVCNHFSLYGQIGGRDAFEFLNLPASSRLTALGGQLPGVRDADVSLALSNPAMLNASTNGQLSVSHNFHFADIQNGYIGFGKRLQRWKIDVHAGVQYIHYGNFTYADDLGIQGGGFSASEKAFVVGGSRKLADRITAGINLKGVFSNLESYSSTGLLSDFSLMYHNDSASFAVTLLVKNLGYELTTYNGQRFGTPLDVQVGITKRLKYLPFRFSIIAHQLHRANVRYDDPARETETDIFGESITESEFSVFLDNMFRHLIVNGEFLLGKRENLRLRAGYNHLRRKELSLTTFRSMAGFSLGVGIKSKLFMLDYGLGYYHLAGATNHITMQLDVARLFKRF